MNLSEQDKWVIKQYEQDEEMMVLIYAQWCVNHHIDAVRLYEEAYPEQPKNKLLIHALEATNPKEISEEISTDVLFHVLHNFGNDDLVFAIQEKLDEMEKRKKKS